MLAESLTGAGHHIHSDESSIQCCMVSSALTYLLAFWIKFLDHDPGSCTAKLAEGMFMQSSLLTKCHLIDLEGDHNAKCPSDPEGAVCQEEEFRPVFPRIFRQPEPCGGTKAVAL